MEDHNIVPSEKIDADNNCSPRTSIKITKLLSKGTITYNRRIRHQ